MSRKVLVVDDEKLIVKGLRFSLEQDGMEVDCAYDGEEALEKAKAGEYDIILLDLMLPKMDGLEVCQQIREFSNVPIVMLTAKGEDMDKIMGLEYGADDYLTKPFNPLEAVARIQSNIRRFYSLGGHDGKMESETANLKVRDLTLDTESCVLYREKEPIELSSVEYRIMYMFMEHPGKVFTKGQIFQAGWNEEYMDDDNNVMVCISKLRAKLSNDGSKYIKTVRGLGYRLEK